MARWLARWIALVALIGAPLAAQDLPKHDDDESFEIEPPLLIPNRENEPLPAAPGTMVTPAVDLEKLTRDLERAKRSAGSAERLFKIGAIAKVEAEQRALRVVRLQADLENARLAQAKEELAARAERKVAGETSPTNPSEVDTDLARAIEAAHAAVAKRERAELEAAEINLKRQQKLLALGSGRKSEVARAERKLAELKAGKD
jgi:hypothetical protein